MREVNTFYYTDGNTVRKIQQPLPNRETRKREIEEERRRQARRQQRAHARMMRQKRMATVATAGLVGVLCLFFVGYITISNNITSHMNQAAELESQVTELKASNSALEGRIASSTNLGVVKQAAINDLGMVYANTDQIVYYSIDDTDSMSQYKAIP
ncbi:MAG: hypothetical protein E7281_05320 [Lachnospiraceae bacterium]|jgi:cell division protein FtsB|nr:hypothetical protein [Lachnospiraceae bacterium]MBQ2089894.1 hypothetical protein [Lachnospiraceae bacterium]MBQ4300592.1 hypothetical protein [Lachnospiraceae bacterium]